MTREDRGAVVITGASSGIGAASALRLARAGFHVFAGVRREEDGHALAEKAEGRLTWLILDVTDGAQIEAAVCRTADATGARGIAGLVNNAGIVVAGALEFLPIEKLREQLELNVVSQLAVTQAFLPLLRKGKGRVINMGSVEGRIAIPFMGPYAASKHAMVALNEALRFELSPWKIHVTMIEPGAVNTAIWSKSRDLAESMAAEYPEEAERLYGPAFDAVRGYVERLSEKAIRPEKVAKAVERALVSRRPKPRYIVGLDSWAGTLATAFVPARMRDYVLRKLMRVPGRP